MPDPAADDREKHREAVLEVHRKYHVANNTADTELLAEVFDDTPTNVYFNWSGHNYRSRAHWSKLWEYYGPRITMDIPWTTFDENITIDGDVAWLTCLRVAQLRWIGDVDSPLGEPEVGLTRATEVFVRRDGQWQIAHAHFSVGALTPRPGNV